MSAPTARQLAEQELTAERAAAYRARSREHLFTLRRAREQTFRQIQSVEEYKARYRTYL